MPTQQTRSRYGGRSNRQPQDKGNNNFKKRGYYSRSSEKQPFKSERTNRPQSFANSNNNENDNGHKNSNAHAEEDSNLKDPKNYEAPNENETKNDQQKSVMRYDPNKSWGDLTSSDESIPNEPQDKSKYRSNSLNRNASTRHEKKSYNPSRKVRVPIMDHNRLVERNN